MINTYNNFLSSDEINHIENLIKLDKWQFFHKSNEEDINLFWKMDLTDDEILNTSVFNKIKKLTNNNFEIERIYFNGHLSCGSGKLHTDSCRDDGRTFLIYCNSVWDVEFGGGTVFYTNDGVVSTIAHPYSAVYFQNNIKHCAQPISKNYKGLRVTLAYKLYLT